jgi:hypothetical protein
VTGAVHAEVKDLSSYDDCREESHDEDCGKFFLKFVHDIPW